MVSKIPNHGFTLIELVVAMGVALLLTSSIIANYNNFTDNQRLKQAALTLKNDLRLAQTKAFSAEKPAGVTCGELVGYQLSFFDSRSYRIQSECDNEELVGPISTINLPTGIIFSPIPSPLLFEVLTRGVKTDDPVIITLVGRIKSYRLRVDPRGDINDLGFQ